MQNLEPQQLIEASRLFRNLQPHETAAIIARLQPASYKRGTRILERGAWHGRLHIIASGEVSVLLQESEQSSVETSTPPVGQVIPFGSRERDLVVARLGPGECFGEMSLITGEPPNATVRAEQDTTLWSLTQTDFLTLIGACPTLLQNINRILSQRLAQTNQQILANHTAERVWLALADNPDAPLERSLVAHIADAMAMRSHKRILVLELCGHDQALGPHFVTHEQQVRPSLLECLHDRTHLQLHHAPTATADGQHYPVYASLAATDEQALTLDAGILASLTDFATLYDYLLLITMRTTPTHLVQAVQAQSQRAITLISVGAEPLQHVPQKSAVFVAHVSERPTIGVKDRYAEQSGYAVTGLLPADTLLLEQCWEQQVTLRQQAPDAALTKAVDFVARHIVHQTIGIAFGGGGARGFAHLGVLERLLHYGIPLDYIAGCSSGIIAPGMYLIGKSLAESEEIFLDIQRHIVQWRFPRTSIFSNKGLKRMLREMCGELRFEDLTTPFAMVAVDLATRAGVVLDRGLLWQAGLASVALPTIFPPVLIGEHILMDAGMHDPVPIRLVRQMGADILLASELGGQEPPSLMSATPWFAENKVAESPGDSPLLAGYLPPRQDALSGGQVSRGGAGARSPHIIDLLLRTYELTMATIGMHSIREADVVFRPKLHRISLRQFSEGRKFVVAGREAVEQSLPALRKRLPWL
ncbi:MAG TPA: cyclic nucleotide-binding and patatin-like phospholipase domain-containing protein [Ktedonobacteraceae bacterium]|nr:cyclic nucleotide-binding and patatin-like phospholipase domain-containing protein [Ktedonobacteraceae bacterium]